VMSSELAKERHNAKVVGYTKCGVCGDQIELLEGVECRSMRYSGATCERCYDLSVCVK
jgi:hypothetical protein